MERLIGCGSALVTPFQADGSLDEAAFRALVRRQVEAGIDFLVPVGTTGESPTLTFEEKVLLIRWTVQEAAGKPVYGGAGGYDTREVIHLAEAYAKVGAYGILSVTPYYNKPTQAGLRAHYRAVASACELPIILYSVAPRTNVNLEPDTVAELAQIPNIVAIKEASGSLAQVAAILHRVPDDFLVLSGDDAVTLALIGLGGHGLISVASNLIPGPMTEMVRAANRGDFAVARSLQRQWYPLMEANFMETNPQPLKHAMHRLGLLEPNFRLPLVTMGPENQARMDAVLRQVGLLS